VSAAPVVAELDITASFWGKEVLEKYKVQRLAKSEGIASFQIGAPNFLFK